MRDYYSNSSLSTMATCETKAYLKYIAGLYDYEEDDEGGSNPMKAGKAVHQALEAYLQSKGSQDAALAALDSYRDHADLLVQPNDRLSYANVHDVVLRWMMLHPLDKLPFNVIQGYTEVELNVEDTALGKPYKFIIDWIVEDKVTGELGILDHKTTGRLTPGWRDKWALDAQLTSYVWGASQLLKRPVTTAWVNAIELNLLPGSGRRCNTHGMSYRECRLQHCNFAMLGPYPRTPQLIGDWGETARRFAERYAIMEVWHAVGGPDALITLKQEGMFTGACGFCPFRQFCMAGRSPSHLQGMIEAEQAKKDHAEVVVPEWLGGNLE